ncbi:TPA: Fe-S cluster assembly ATPase SufC [Candidatus Peribacteria bacterium]|nr:MAG: Fe-S cluster assembly ATPase SufC [Candidatus Peribacteria bacterium RIFOXYD2_FULL_58_15]HAI98024.1 Fe-S cluster assembly ATPase SufC [Candidatus Peribacteria bacterium]HAS34610.1 Fe-S cluster assembly ATPase SufC [Candidatus Peribacteria bacterium]
MASTSPLLTVTQLRASVAGHPILHGVDLTVRAGEIHVIMGPNGAGKSTFVHALMGHPSVSVAKGKVLFRGHNLLGLSPDERARAGLFLAFQYPREIAGVTLGSLLFSAYRAQAPDRMVDKGKMTPVEFRAHCERKARELHMSSAFLERPVNVGFSGGEKKKAEILQLAVLCPALALLDEMDSGLDIDALKVITQGIEALRSPRFSAILVTHYARLLHHLKPDRVHVMVAGSIVESGGAALAKRLEREGYAKYGKGAETVRMKL